jgi:hypothetical protein
MNKKIPICLIAVSVLCLFASVNAAEFKGSARVGYVVFDEEGSENVNQPSYNLYPGLSLSLERFSLRFANGTRFYGDLRDITLNNRNLRAGLTRSGKYGLTIRHNQYRRNYSTDGGDFTRRRLLGGQIWIQPIRSIRLFGGLDQTWKHGTSHDLYVNNGASRAVDFNQTRGNIGLRYAQDRRTAMFEYRLAKFSDKTEVLSDRLVSRYRFTAAAPVPTRDDLLINAGYQYYKAEVRTQQDTLTTNAFWGGVTYFLSGFTFKYSGLFDRSRRTGDIVATDNILNGLYVSHNWHQRSGATVGYRHRTTDDAYNDKAVNGYFLSAWCKAMTNFTFRAGYGNEQTSINSGPSLTGDRSYTRLWGAIKFRLENSGIDLKIKNRKTENDGFRGYVKETELGLSRGIAHSTDFVEIATNLFCASSKCGTFSVGYSYSDGNYTNDSGMFAYREHVLTGDYEAQLLDRFDIELGATWLRAKRDLDYERSNLRGAVAWEFRPQHRFEVRLSIQNFDNYIDPSPVYTEYYTANVITINMIKEL